MPSLGMLAINALTAANGVLIPVQAQYLSAKGLEQLLHTVSRVQRQFDPKLKIDGIPLAMVDTILLLILAYLISPLGLPMAAAWLLARVQDLRYAIMDALA